jgi:hypothetical protein
MENVFIDRRRAAVRMKEEIQRSKRLWIQGITLKAFFDDSDIADALKTRIRNQKDEDDIKVMLLDPDCDQARVRAYREFVLNSGNVITFDEFARDNYSTSKLRRDLLETEEKIKEIQLNTGRSSIMKKYRTAPHMFVVIGDSAAFVEQYTYGKLNEYNPDKEIILGSDMPLIEYQRRIDPIYTQILKDIRSEENETAEQLRPQPYLLLLNHFQWTWEQAF